MAPARYSRRAVLRMGASSAAAAAFLAACGRGGGGLLTSPPSVPRGKRSGDLRIGYAAPTGNAVGLADAVYSRLVAFDPRNGRAYGDLAERLEVTPDGMTVAANLREGMHFHPNAQNLADSLSADNIRRDFAQRRAMGEYLFSTAVDRIEAPDTRTVVLNMRAPFSLLLDYLGDTATGGVRAATSYAVVEASMGSGPFVPAAHEEAGTTLVANPLYYRSGVPLLDRIHVLDGGSPRDLAAAVAAGELDLAFHPADAGSDQVRAPRGAAVTLLRRTSRRMRALGFSLAPEKAAGVTTRAVPAFQDARVRRAASLALNREALRQLDDSTIAGPVGPAHVNDALSREELAKHPLYKHDPQQAKQLLAAAGVPDLGFALEGANRAQTRAVITLVEQQLREVGFQPRTRLLPVADWERLFLGGDFEVGVVELDDMRTPDVGLRLCMSGGLSGTFSLSGFSSPAFDTAARKVFNEVDPRRRGERSRAAQRVLLDEVPPLLPLGSPPDHATIANRFQGFEFDAFEFNTTWGVAGWRVAAKQ